MTNLGKRVSAITFFLIMFCSILAAQETVAFYGIQSPDADVNMLSMTEDLYYKQLSDMPVSVLDKRSETLKKEIKEYDDAFFEQSGCDYIFFAEIKKLPDSKWVCTLNMRNESLKQIQTFSKEYDSYYKILMESKSSIKSILSGLFADGTKQDAEKPLTTNRTQVTTDSIAGTWTSAESVSKIVIMRGNRGFIIFKNGATMNISVKSTYSENGGAQFNITQTSSSNASFFPEIDRRLAMEAAVSAKPIEWNLSINEDGNLEGTKITLVQQGETVQEGSVSVKWTRQN
ncbi:MAG: hypothetical protein IJL70_10555 [Treponema sp.]|nr:hypothetical protein [Treponema sp.]